MFHGTIKGDGNIDLEGAHSNNFTVTRNSVGSYTITFTQYLRYAPELSIGVSSTSSFHAVYAVSRWNQRNKHSDPVSVTVETRQVGGSLRDLGFSFAATCGMTRVIDVSELADRTLILYPEVVPFNHPQEGTKHLLMLRAEQFPLVRDGDGPFYLDKGTTITCVGRDATIALEKNKVSLNGCHDHVWDLTGWTYGPGMGARGQKWETRGERSNPVPFVRLNLVKKGGALSTPFAFAIKGTQKNQIPDAGDTLPDDIFSDPVVTLSTVAPGGLVLS